ncbi:hypothetical protein A2856_00865 [Candidatus Uhrbacteria bacterium RIFCSPHIGHO2_01_FULL_63_20]|uniref:BrnT family toxin n=1 Tax=Candidatus Uhrbacteria bacterium RIFCSPHIGHO2_01_FULL_63_20 TaxID=1802385 RepID=A0A1F7TNA7_9BACT|nr:MAG: hypothetical protein A2856_00865 [Candidatus Uhrbacteria bacterium RIFCSPHIGHO2_01_FULL_63_20]
MLPDLGNLTGFEWDAGNERKSASKHGVAPRECEEAFFNDPVLLLDDHGHSLKEPRFHLLGRTDAHRKLFITFTVRKTRIRVISARPMNRKERIIYEKT